MDTTAWTLPDNYKPFLDLAMWAVAGLGGLWLVTGVIGYMHRRAYNLTHAESGGSQNIKPDFLKVDHAARQAAKDRGEAFDKQLLERGAAPPAPAESVSRLARIGATATAVFTLAAAIIGTLTKADVIQSGAQKIGSFEKIGAIFREYPVGAGIAVVIIIANVISFAGLDKKKKK